MPDKALVLDANILIRAVLGTRCRIIIETYAEQVMFVVPRPEYAEAEEHLTELLVRHGSDPVHGLIVLQNLAALVELVESETYGRFETEARELMDERDPDERDPNDWPILATALALGCPIWTEDTDFFGCGVSTWTSRRVEKFLRKAAE